MILWYTALLHIHIPLVCVLPGGPCWPGWPGGPGIYALDASTFSPVICLLRSAALFGSKATCQNQKSLVRSSLFSWINCITGYAFLWTKSTCKEENTICVIIPFSEMMRQKCHCVRLFSFQATVEILPVNPSGGQLTFRRKTATTCWKVLWLLGSFQETSSSLFEVFSLYFPVSGQHLLRYLCFQPLLSSHSFQSELHIFCGSGSVTIPSSPTQVWICCA